MQNLNYLKHRITFAQAQNVVYVLPQGKVYLVSPEIAGAGGRSYK